MKNLYWIFIISFLFPFSAWSNIVWSSEDLKIEQISEHVYVHTSYFTSPDFGRFPSNGAVIVQDGKAVIVDTPMTNDLTSFLCNFLIDSLKLELKYFVPGHYHDDCIGGISIIHELGITSIGNHLTKQKCKELKIEGPKRSFRNRKNINLKGLDIELFYPGAGHAEDNLVVWVGDDKVLFGGCLVKNVGSRNLGNIDDAVVDEWANSIRNLKKRYPELKLVIPGHGDYGGVELLNRTIELAEDYVKQNR